MQELNTPVYLDWTFWAAVLAFVAILLSQLPPINQLLRPGRLTLELYSRIHVTHKVGNPNVQLYIILTNNGGRSVRVNGIKLKLSLDGKHVVELPAQNYLQNPHDTSTLLFTSFLVKPKEDWSHFVNFLNFFSRADDKKYRAAELALKTDIFAKKQLPENKDRIVEAAANLVEVFCEMFDEKFIWKHGEYEAHVIVESATKRSQVERRFRFTLFESDSEELRAVRTDYRLGDGLYWDSVNHTGVLIQIVQD
jgi:hypothetical protein